MNLDLNRVDYTLVGLTSPRCMKLLPNNESKSHQKVAVGDKDGVLQVFSIKKGDLQYYFKTQAGPEISCLELGGALGTLQDKIFISTENEVRGYTKKGKLFLGFDTNLTDSIKAMYVYGSDLFICGNQIYNHFYDCKEVNSYLCNDKINDVIGNHKSSKLVAVLACDDRVIRFISRSQIVQSINLDASPTILHLTQQNELLVGTDNGRLGIVPELSANFSEIEWILSNENKKPGICCIDTFDMTGDGVNDILIGRNDGSIEVHSLMEDVGLVSKFNYISNESITSIQGGYVSSSNHEEILVSTYTGWLFGLTSEVQTHQMGNDLDDSNVPFSQEMRQKVEGLRNEITEIEMVVNKERERYQATTQNKHDGVSAIPYVSINDSFSLVKEEACYRLVLEVATQIDNVLVQSDILIDLLDTDKNSAVISFSAVEPQSGNNLLATYRCQLNTTRLELKMGTTEGQSGLVRVYVTPLVQPKCCQIRKYLIKPLSLHSRCHDFDTERAYNTLTLSGSFSLSEIHTWVSLCLPQIPDKPPAGESVEFTFVSSMIGTLLKIEYKKGEAIFNSDNISTIAILKDVISKEATKKKIILDISFNLEKESISRTLHLLNPKIEKEIHYQKDIELLNALKEMSTENNDIILPEYIDIISREKELNERKNNRISKLDRLYGIITDLYIDLYKFKGVNVKQRIPSLLEILESYDLENLIQFFLLEL